MSLDAALAEQIRALEVRLLDPRVRRAPEELDALLADDFFEFGSSGRTFDKKQIVDELHHESRFEASVEDFCTRLLGPDAVLATYRAVARLEDDEVRRSLRSSIWVRRKGLWQMVFHQGTLTT